VLLYCVWFNRKIPWLIADNWNNLSTIQQVSRDVITADDNSSGTKGQVFNQCLCCTRLLSVCGAFADYPKTPNRDGN
jgi:hypothetical protein